ncbi:succinate--CoA ligase [ADP-forming] subunit beta [Spirochaetota bacterium]|nr:succinate--CoA ligase [ADP-forming] subunit beta [Spirochaetota bacterium]
MKIHEYQAKKLFKEYEIPIQDGYIVEREADIEDTVDRVSRDFPSNGMVVKAQVHAGGRGKGGGVKFSPSREAAIANARKILGMTLITPQTGAEGRLVKKIMITEGIDIEREFYVALTMERSLGKHVWVVSQAGGMDIEEVARKTPEKILKLHVAPATALRGYQARQLAYALGLSGPLFKDAIKLFKALYRFYLATDASIVEINPLVVTKDNRLLALDAKVNFDDNALFKYPHLKELHDENEEDPSELEAQKHHLNFIKLTGNVGCMVNGAGLAMATMDLIKLKGGNPANFLDVGGTASAETVKNAFKIITSDPNVKAILINIFGGIVRCDRVANGVVAAAKELELTIPVVVRLVGTNADIAKKIIDESGVKVTSAETFEVAAQKVVDLVQ